MTNTGFDSLFLYTYLWSVFSEINLRVYKFILFRFPFYIVGFLYMSVLSREWKLRQYILLEF